MLFGAFVIKVEISTYRLTAYLSEDLDPSYYHSPNALVLQAKELGDILDVMRGELF
jgi:hypothetical protein